MATGCLSLPKAPDIEGAERFRGRGVLHQPLAARRRRLLRQAGGGHRHRLVGHPVDPDHRPAGGRAHRLPAHAELLPARQERAGVRRRRRRRSTPIPRAYREAARLSGAGVPREPSLVRALQVSEAERLATYEEAYAVRRPPRPRRGLRRHRREPRGQRDRVRVPARQDPLDRARSARRRRRSARRTTSTAPSGRASTPTTTRPSTCRTSAWSTCARTRSGRSPRRASTRRRGRSSSTPSSSPPASTR